MLALLLSIALIVERSVTGASTTGLNYSCGAFKDRRDFLTVEACSVGGGKGSSGLTC